MKLNVFLVFASVDNKFYFKTSFIEITLIVL